MILKAILDLLDAKDVVYEFEGDEQVEIHQVAGLDLAQSNNLSFLTDNKYRSFLETTQAGAVILPQNLAGNAYPFSVIFTENPYYAYALVAQLLNPRASLPKGVHPSASIDPTSQLDASVNVAPNVTIMANVNIGAGTQISAGSVIEDNVVIGENCWIGPNVTLHHDCKLGDQVIIEAGTVIGGDGFGWANHQGEWVKIPQIGRVIIGNRVSIGNQVAIDRGALQNTVIEDNCIIDNLVHIAHNVVIGSGSAIAGQVGFAGSTTLGKHCTVAGQAGFAGHIEITDHAHFMAKAGVTHDIKEPGAYSGFPAVKATDWQKNSVRIRQLDKLAKQVKQLQKQIDALSD